MLEIKVDPLNLPQWAKNYFEEFNKWKENKAPKTLPTDVEDFVQLFAREKEIDFEVRSEINAQQTAIEHFVFSWKSAEAQTMFLLRF